MEEYGPVKHLIDPKKKNKKWHLNAVKYYYNECKNTNSNGFWWKRQDYDEINLYARGRQAIDKYKPWLLQVDDKEAYNEWVNLNYKIVSPAPKLRNIALNIVNKLGFNIVSTAIDKTAEEEKKQTMAAMASRILLREVFSEDEFPKEVENEPETFEDLKMYGDYFYRHPVEIEFEEKFDTVATHNNYEEIKKRFRESLFDYGVCAGMEYLDEHGVVKIKQRDIRQMIVGPSKERDFSDAEYFGFMRLVSPSDFEQETGQLNEEEKEAIREKFDIHFSSSIESELADPEQTNDNKLEVLDFYFKSTNVVKFEEKIAHGNKTVRRVKFNRNPQSENRKVKERKYTVWYKVSWVVDTDYIFNWGLCNDMKRRKNSLADALPPVFIYATDVYQGQPRGIMEQMIPLLDDYQLDWLRLQKVKAEAKANGLAMDLSAIENIELGSSGEALTKQDIIDLYSQRNIYPYRSIGPDGNPSNIYPFQALPGGIGPALTELIESMRNTMLALYDVIGFNEVSAGGNVDPRTGVGLSDQMAQSTNNALYHIVDGARYMTEQVAKAVDIRFNDAAAKNKLHKTYTKALGKNSIFMAMQNSNYNLHDLSFKIEDKPDDYQRQQMDLKIDKFLDNDKITAKAAATIRNTDNVKKQEMLLGYFEDKWLKQKDQMEKEKIQLNNEGAKNAAIESETAKVQGDEQRHLWKMEELNLEHHLIMEKERFLFEKERTLKAMDVTAKKDVADINAEAKIESTDILVEGQEEVAKMTNKNPGDPKHKT